MIQKKVIKGKRKIDKITTKYGYRQGFKVILAKAWYRFIGKSSISFLKKTITRGKDRYIVMESRPDFSDNARALYEYMIENGYNKKYHITWLVNDPKRYRKYRTKNVKFVRKFGRFHRRRTIRAFYHTLRAKYVVFTHACRWVAQKNENQIYINLWHGCGYKSSRGEEGLTNIFDYCLVPGDVFVETKMEFFGCPKEKIIPIGYPRYNQLKKDNPKVDELFNHLNPKATKNILWMPTFRESRQLLYYKDPIPSIIGFPLMRSVLDFEKLDEISREANVNLIIKWHRNAGGCSGDKQESTNVFYLDNKDLEENDIQLYELIAKTDALITDFSSVAIDYLLLDRPIGFTMDDYEDYKNTRGFVFEDPKKYMPGTYLYDLDGLKTFLCDVAAGKDEFAQNRKEIMGETHNITDDYCQRILEYFDLKI